MLLPSSTIGRDRSLKEPKPQLRDRTFKGQKRQELVVPPEQNKNKAATCYGSFAGVGGSTKILAGLEGR